MNSALNELLGQINLQSWGLAWPLGRPGQDEKWGRPLLLAVMRAHSA